MEEEGCFYTLSNTTNIFIDMGPAERVWASHVAYNKAKDAIRHNDLCDLSYALKDRNLDINVTTWGSGHTLLSGAIARSSVEVVKILLDVGADPNTIQDDGTTSMDMIGILPEIVAILRLYGGKKGSDCRVI